MMKIPSSLGKSTHVLSVGSTTKKQAYDILKKAAFDFSYEKLKENDELGALSERDVEIMINDFYWDYAKKLHPKFDEILKIYEVDRNHLELSPVSRKRLVLNHLLEFLTAKTKPEDNRTLRTNDGFEDKEKLKEDMIRLLLSGPPKLMRPNGSSKHHLIEFLRTVSDIKMSGETDLNSYQSFVVEHDWLAAFSGTPEFDGEEIPPLPFEKCCFEFLINNVRVLAFIGVREDGEIYNFISIGHRGRWYGNHNEWRNGKFSPGAGVFSMDGLDQSSVVPFVRGQIRAVCIMLDSEVAVREMRRVSEKLNRSRVKSGKTPLKDYHVVSLSRRFRADRTEPGVTTEHARKRCHWRRGHWRHYADHKTWIKWMLVGDPALGFVEKSYRA